MFRCITRSLELSNGIGIWIMHTVPNSLHEWSVAERVELKFKNMEDECFLLPEPTLRIDGPQSLQFVQSLIESIEESGWIKSKLKNDSKESDALKENLKDLRHITNRLIDLTGNK